MTFSAGRGNAKKKDENEVNSYDNDFGNRTSERKALRVLELLLLKSIS